MKTVAMCRVRDLGNADWKRQFRSKFRLPTSWRAAYERFYRRSYAQLGNHFWGCKLSLGANNFSDNHKFPHYPPPPLPSPLRNARDLTGIVVPSTCITSCTKDNVAIGHSNEGLDKNRVLVTQLWFSMIFRLNPNGQKCSAEYTLQQYTAKVQYLRALNILPLSKITLSIKVLFLPNYTSESGSMRAENIARILPQYDIYYSSVLHTILFEISLPDRAAIALIYRPCNHCSIIDTASPNLPRS